MELEMELASEGGSRRPALGGVPEGESRPAFFILIADIS